MGDEIDNAVEAYLAAYEREQRGVRARQGLQQQYIEAEVNAVVAAERARYAIIVASNRRTCALLERLIALAEGANS
jgi:hypothetical protein